MSSLVRADINLNGHELFHNVETMSYTKEFLENFQHMPELRVGPLCFKAVSVLGLKGWQLSQSSRKHLTVTSSRDNMQSISGIICLLNSSPYLETLVIEGCDTEGEYSVLDPGAKGDLDGDLVCLKTIQIRNFADPTCERILTLAQILLKRATTLEEIVIDVVEDSFGFGRMAKTLLTYPRSSKTAVVLSK